MSLLTLWKQDEKQITDKTVQQLISFAGEGKLADGNRTSAEFRELLQYIPSDILQKYAHQCLDQSFDKSGYVLQDIINEIGTRLDFEVTSGRYQGKQGIVGFDGQWKMANGHSIIAEVKTTDAYRINIDTISKYRKSLIEKGQIIENHSSILIIVGRQDTGDLEAQIRGSRYAWDIRIISVDSLIRMMLLNEGVEDPQNLRKMHEILVPREFTRLDEIIEIIFLASEEVKSTDVETLSAGEDGIEVDTKSSPMAYHRDCVDKVQIFLKQSLIPRSKVLYSTPNKDISLVCLVSKEYVHGDRKTYWYGFHPYQRDFLKQSKQGYVAFGCGDKDSVLVSDYPSFEQWLKYMNKTERPNRYYWHVHIYFENNELFLRLNNNENINLSKYLIT